MDYLYLFLNLGSIAIPFIFSFHPKLQFYKLWKPLFISIFITMLIFIPWDVIFTNSGIWGFNEAYFLDYKFLNLPIEEWLFFICIPYACVFTHYALIYYFPKQELTIKNTKITSYVLLSILAIITAFSLDKWYTFINFLLAIILVLVVLNYNLVILSKFYLTFLIMLIPFFIVNGILTGSIIENEVVWYNNEENLGLRIFTIPIEDSVYAFSLILMNLFLLETIKTKRNTNEEVTLVIN